jgi:hypothetical protein
MKYSKAFIIPLLMVCWAGAMARSDKHGKKPGPQIERVATVDPNVLISVCVASGDIKVRGWDRNQVRARSSDAPEIELRRSGPGDSAPAKEIAVLTSDDERRQPASCMADVDIELDVPRGASVKVQTRDGDIQVTDVSAVEAKSMNGDIHLDGVKRAAEADTLGGNVSLRNASGSAKLHSVGGSVEALEVGPGAAGDTFEAATVGGDIALEKSSYLKVEVGSVGGNLNISGPLARSAHYELKTISGDIHLSLPPDSSFRLDAKLSQNSELSTDFPLKSTTDKDQSTETPPKPPVPPVPPMPPGKKHGRPYDPAKPSVYGLQHINGVYGAGDALLSISSFSGGIYLQKK